MCLGKRTPLSPFLCLHLPVPRRRLCANPSSPKCSALAPVSVRRKARGILVSIASQREGRREGGREGRERERAREGVRGRPMICARRWPWPGFERMNTRPEQHIGVSPATRCEALLRCARPQLATTRRSSGSCRSSRLCWLVSAAVGAALARRGY